MTVYTALFVCAMSICPLIITASETITLTTSDKQTLEIKKGTACVAETWHDLITAYDEDTGTINTESPLIIETSFTFDELKKTLIPLFEHIEKNKKKKEEEKESLEPTIATYTTEKLCLLLNAADQLNVKELLQAAQNQTIAQLQKEPFPANWHALSSLPRNVKCTLAHSLLAHNALLPTLLPPVTESTDTDTVSYKSTPLVNTEHYYHPHHPNLYASLKEPNSIAVYHTDRWKNSTLLQTFTHTPEDTDKILAAAWHPEHNYILATLSEKITHTLLRKDLHYLQSKRSAYMHIWNSTTGARIATRELPALPSSLAWKDNHKLMGYGNTGTSNKKDTQILWDLRCMYEWFNCSLEQALLLRQFAIHAETATSTHIDTTLAPLYNSLPESLSGSLPKPLRTHRTSSAQLASGCFASCLASLAIQCCCPYAQQSPSE
jgi:hypothetical protein